MKSLLALSAASQLLSSFFSKGDLYLDPGSGSILVQILVASLATLGIFFTSNFSRIKAYFQKSDKKTAEEAVAEEDDFLDD